MLRRRILAPLTAAALLVVALEDPKGKAMMKLDDFGTKRFGSITEG